MESPLAKWIQNLFQVGKMEGDEKELKAAFGSSVLPEGNDAETVELTAESAGQSEQPAVTINESSDSSGAACEPETGAETLGNDKSEGLGLVQSPPEASEAISHPCESHGESATESVATVEELGSPLSKEVTNTANNDGLPNPSPLSSAGDWHHFLVSVQGAKNKCQDAGKFSVLMQGKRAVTIGSVSDGHGSERYVRSQRGSVFATLAWELACTELVKHPQQADGKLEDKLASEFLSQWDKLVTADMNEENILRETYGATFLGFAIADGNCYIAQIGDGTMMSCNLKTKDLKIERVLSDENLPGEDTHSLSQPRDVRKTHIRVRTLPITSGFFIALATDGLDKSFTQGPEGFERFYIDVANRLKEDGVSNPPNNQLKAEIKDKVEGCTRGGSRDDVTVLIAYMP